MKKMLFILGMIALLAIGASYVYAAAPGSGPGNRGPENRQGWGYENWSSFTPEQQAKFQDLRQKFDQETAQLRGNIVTKRLELRSLWADPKSDPNAILAKEKELISLQDQMREKFVQFRLQARSLLTPEQLAQFRSGWGMDRGFGRGYMMGGGYGRFGMGPGGMGSGYGCF